MQTKSLYALVMMQLKNKLDLSNYKSTKNKILKIGLSVLSFVLITAVIYALFYVARLLNIFHLADIIPTSVIVVVFTIMELLAIVSCTYGLMKNLYFSKDNQVLLTLPVTTNQVFLSKLIVFYLYELIKSCYFILPLFIGYGLISGLSVGFYFWAILCVILIATLTVSISSLLSIFAMLINMFLKNYYIIKMSVFAVCVGLVIWAVVSVIGMIPANLDIVGSWGSIFWEIQDFLSSFVVYFWPFAKITEMVVGGRVGLKPVLFNINTLWVFLAVIGVIALTLILTFLISKPIFFKMASKPFEYRKNTNIHIKKNYKLNSFLSSVNKEFKMIFRDSDDSFSILGVAIALPILILLLNKIFAAMSTRMFGDFMTTSFNVLIMLLIALSSNGKIASIYSREGSAAYLMKTRPLEYRKNLIAKLVPNILIMTISIIASVSVYSNFTTLSVVNIMLFFLVIESIYLLHLFWSAEMDIMNPQTMQYSTTGQNTNNPNERNSTIATFFLSFVFFVATLFLSIENIEVSWIKIFAIAFVCLVYRVWSYLSKIKYYYKEK